MCSLPINLLHKRHRRSHKNEPPTPPPAQHHIHHADRLAYEAQQRHSYTAARIAFAAHQQAQQDLRFNTPRPAPQSPHQRFTTPRPAPQPPHQHSYQASQRAYQHHQIQIHSQLSRADSRRRAQERLRNDILRAERAERLRAEARAERKRVLHEEQRRFAEEQWQVLVDGGSETQEARERAWEEMVRRKRAGGGGRRKGERERGGKERRGEWGRDFY